MGHTYAIDVMWIYSRSAEARPEARTVDDSPRAVIDLSEYMVTGEQWWSGRVACDSGECPVFSAVMPLSDKGCIRYPLWCPYCSQDDAFPIDVWRTLEVECTGCAHETLLAVPNPAAPWPESVKCEQCNAPILTPAPAANVTH